MYFNPLARTFPTIIGSILPTKCGCELPTLTEIRKIIYTTNIIEGLNLQFRQITKNKPSFTNDDSLRRMLYLASQRIVKHWHARYQNWDLVLSQLEIMFADRAIG